MTVVGVPVEIVAGANTSLTPGQPIELAFDRLLMPLSIVRQTFVLEDLAGNALAPPAVAYDPVARVVTVTPQDNPLSDGQAYRLFVLAPSSPTDANGVRGIDGAPLDPKWTAPLTFPIVGTAAPTSTLAVDYCNVIQPIFNQCAGGQCHSGPMPAAGLWLTSPEGVLATALGRAAQGSNTGPMSGPGQLPQAPPQFGIDMPIIDATSAMGQGGDPGNSWLIYKVLLAVPSAAPTMTTHSVPWVPLSAGERATLANYVLGREMPFPPNPSAPLGTTGAMGLSGDELEQLSFWIAQGALVPASCPP